MRDAPALLAVIDALLRESRPAGTTPPPLALDSRLEDDLGIDSLARAELLLRVERAFDVRLPEHLVAQARTPRDLLRAVQAGSAGGAPEPVSTPIVQAPTADFLPARAATLAEVLDFHADRHPDRVHVVVLPEDGEGAGEPLTYGALREEARAVAAGLAAVGLGAGDTVAMMLPTSRDFFRAFMGVVLAGAVPVPLYPPAGAAGLEEHLRRQSGILRNCGAAMLLTVEAAKPVARVLRALVPTLRRVATLHDLPVPAAPPALPVRGAADLAMLQYTSGSTGDPKGVALTHANVLANIRAMGAAVHAGPRDVFVSWLPLYHDMGLIGAWLGGLCFAYPLVVMPPTAFVNRPSRWLRALHRFGGTLSSAPNFAYEICATRVDERDLHGLDLSAWRLAFNGAEPVRADTLERFAARLAPYGFRRAALMPVYGLAECAVGLAFPAPGRGPRVDHVARTALADAGEARPVAAGDRDAVAFVACGVALPGHELRIAAADGREAAERAEGRIQFRGPSATAGYYRNPEKTRELFRGAWLDSGDLGYVADGELFVTSRAKDVVIRGGHHVHPYEIEEAVGEVPGVRKGCVAVFGVPDAASGSERVVALVETRLRGNAERDALRARVAQAVLAATGAPADEVVIAAPHTVPKTSSGKIRRAASRELYLRGALGRRRLAAWRARARFAASLAGAQARRAARALAGLAYATWLWSIGVPLALAALLVSLLPASRARWRALRAVARALLRCSRLPLSASGLERIPAEGPVVIVANHASYLDGPLLFALLPRPVEFVAKRELAALPLVARVLRAAGVRFVERFDVERSIGDARDLEERARAGAALVFFAEGTFTRAPGLLPFHMGAFLTSARSGAPLVPLALRGTRSILREGYWRPRRAAVAVHAGDALRAAAPDWAAAAALRERARAEVLAHCGEPDLARYA